MVLGAGGLLVQKVQVSLLSTYSTRVSAAVLNDASSASVLIRMMLGGRIQKRGAQEYESIPLLASTQRKNTQKTH